MQIMGLMEKLGFLVFIKYLMGQKLKRQPYI